MTAGNPQPGDQLFVEYPDPSRHRIGTRYEPWKSPNDARAWIRGEHDAQPVEISQQVKHWRVDDAAHELTVTGSGWEAVAQTDRECSGASGLVSGRIQRVTNTEEATP